MEEYEEVRKSRRIEIYKEGGGVYCIIEEDGGGAGWKGGEGVRGWDWMEKDEGGGGGGWRKRRMEKDEGGWNYIVLYCISHRE